MDAMFANLPTETTDKLAECEREFFSEEPPTEPKKKTIKLAKKGKKSIPKTEDVPPPKPEPEPVPEPEPPKFHDCDPTGKGNRLCMEGDYPKSVWCEECLYLTRDKSEDYSDDEPEPESEPESEPDVAVGCGQPIPLCPPVNKKAQRTFVNLGIDPRWAERFKVNDTCDRCGHFFKRGMIKEYHYTSKNCQKKKPYSETEKGQTGKGGEHTARKARKAADPTRELTKEINAWRKTNQLMGFFTFKDNKAKKEDWDTLWEKLESIPIFIGWIIKDVEEAKRITQTRSWNDDTSRLLGKIGEIKLEVEHSLTTVSLGGVEMGSKGGNKEQVSVSDYMEGKFYY